jgi:SAM-dependent methyltransferase
MTGRSESCELVVMNWEENYVVGDTPWDLGEPAPPLLELLATRPAGIWGEDGVLVPGCGRGHDAAALQESGRRVIGLDVALSALADAEALYGNRVSWLAGDFFDGTLAERNRVGAIFEHTCFCAIPPEKRADYVEASLRWLQPEGRLVGIFFLDPLRRSDEEAGPPYGAEKEEIRDLFSADFEITREILPSRSHPEWKGREWVVEMIRTH